MLVNLDTQAVALKSLYKDEYLLSSISERSTGSFEGPSAEMSLASYRTLLPLTSLSDSFLELASVIISGCGHSSMGFVSQSGPFHHIEEGSSSGGFPLVARSAGLSSDET